MKLIDLCTAFPADPADWPVQNPSRAIDFNVRARIRTAFGGIIASCDVARHKASSRIGIETRPFELGDSLAAISRPHFIRTGALQTRIDFSPGRQTAGFIFHGYSNLEYASQENTPKKGQVGWAATALVQAVHQSMSHACPLLYLTQTDLGAGIARITRQVKRWDYCYIVTDLLHNSKSENASVEELIEGLLRAGIHKPQILAVRDVLEWDADNPLGDKKSKEQLLPLEKTYNKDKIYFSGEQYIANLKAQKIYAQKKIAEQLQGSIQWLTCDTSIDTFLSQILTQLMRKI